MCVCVCVCVYVCIYIYIHIYIQAHSFLRPICYYYCWGTLLVAQLFAALHYKPEDREFDTRWCHWNFSLT